MNELVGLLRTETHCCYHLLHSTRLHCYSSVLLGVHPFVSPGAHTPPVLWASKVDMGSTGRCSSGSGPARSTSGLVGRGVRSGHGYQMLVLGVCIRLHVWGCSLSVDACAWASVDLEWSGVHVCMSPPGVCSGGSAYQPSMCVLAARHAFAGVPVISCALRATGASCSRAWESFLSWELRNLSVPR